MNTIPHQETAQEGTLSGRILICGTGFIVAAGMWAILGFFRYEGGMTGVSMVDLALTAVHVVVGVMVYKRARNIWYVGLALCGVAMAATLANGYYFPLGTNGLLAVLLYLSRPDFPDLQPAKRG